MSVCIHCGRVDCLEDEHADRRRRPRTWLLCPFWTEAEVLEVKLGELAGVVDHFVVAESDRTYMGARRDLLFPQLRTNQLAPWMEQITYVPVIDSPDGDDPWAREHHLRDALGRGLTHAGQDDLVILTDADEVPSAESVRWAQEHVQPGAVTHRFLLHMHLYHLQWRWPELSWGYQIARCARMRDIPRSIQAWRLSDSRSEVLIAGAGGAGAGWHLAYMGGVARIKHKLHQAAHPEMVRPEHSDDSFIQRCIDTGADLFGRAHHITEWVAEDELPAYALANRERLSVLFPEGVAA